MIDDLEWKEASERAEMAIDAEREDWQARIDALTAERDAAMRREQTLLDSNQQERTALVDAANLRAQLMRERKVVEALRARVAKADRLANSVEVFGEWSGLSDEVWQALAAYRAAPTDTGAA